VLCQRENGKHEKVMAVFSSPQSFEKISTGRHSEKIAMTSQTVGYKAKALEPRNLIFFFLIAFRWSWFLWWLLFLSGILTMPGDIEDNLKKEYDFQATDRS
jgi:hypothetical protein